MNHSPAQRAFLQFGPSTSQIEYTHCATDGENAGCHVRRSRRHVRRGKPRTLLSRAENAANGTMFRADFLDCEAATLTCPTYRFAFFAGAAAFGGATVALMNTHRSRLSESRSDSRVMPTTST